ncbi:DNA cytosine methyltransferase [Clostridioides mangenotii]|uniref:DNA cytosine methyltransferase n=1 Tax=Metaclostridioides mangenotii TaxID=1540 RepID=UPI00214A3965|nr:DNA cytosine methyltransferase [Clostridioides mangenotii]MCR1955233.1 DNA cytosine methyltransferase [Clostridioides mangenotii]
MKTYKLGSLFAGVGGIDLGFKQAGFKPVWANEIDEYCEKTFTPNHEDVELLVEDIKNIKGSDIPNIDILAGGFPCQPFSIAGYRQGLKDNRGDLFFHILRLIEELIEEGRPPKVIFLENVKNLFTHDDKRTYSFMKEELTKLGYHVTEDVLNTSTYGNIPQNRERLYIIAFRELNSFKNFKWPKPIDLDKTIEKVIDWNQSVDSKYYYTENLKCYPLLKSEVTNQHSIYQYRRVYVRENKAGLSPTLTANMGMGGHNVPIILDSKNRIRKLTPRECFLLQGFPKDFILPRNISDSRLYKQAGNSVSVPVIERLANQIKEALNYGIDHQLQFIS